MLKISLNRLLFTLLIVVFAANALWAQATLTEVGHLPYSNQLSNLWGYVDADSGTEYAIVGVYNGTSIVSLQNPSTPVEVAFVPGPQGIWREIKTWGHYAYVANETGSGLHIIDLSSLPQSVNSWFWTGVDDPNYDVNVQTIHTISTDEKGYAYLSGSNDDLVIIDLNANPENPPVVGIYDYHYVHDCFVRNDTMWSSEINAGVLSVVDVSDRANPVVLASFATPNNFTHNSALSDDGKTVFTTDEVSAAYIGAYDVSDLTDIQEIDRVRTTPNTGSIPHNVYTVGNFLVTAYYRDGVKIHDATHPDMMIEVADYDTAPTLSGNGFNGCWGVYPYFPSGLIIASDMEEGLFILQPNYVQACYLAGSVTDATTGAPVVNAHITITDVPAAQTSTGFSGGYQTGVTTAGTYTVTISAPGYLPVTYTITLSNGELITLNTTLNSLPQFNFTGMVVAAETGLPVANAQVALISEDVLLNTTTNSSGQFAVNNMFAADYNVIAGKWGYITQQTGSQFVSPETGDLVIQLPVGYYDDFVFDFGWTVQGDAPTGIWERGEPNGTTYDIGYMNPDFDVEGDISNQCYVTGNDPSANVGADDVDNGYTRLTSPMFDLSGYTDPQVSYYRWFANAGGASTPNDHLIISLSNGASTVVVEDLTAANMANNWTQTLLRVSDYLTPTANMHLIFETSDAATSGHLVEAAADWFAVTELAIPNAINTPANNTQLAVSLSPNPFSGQTIFTFANGLQPATTNAAPITLHITDIQGRTLSVLAVNPGATSLTLQQGQLGAGLYFYHFMQNNTCLANGKLVVSK